MNLHLQTTIWLLSIVSLMNLCPVHGRVQMERQNQTGRYAQRRPQSKADSKQYCDQRLRFAIAELCKSNGNAAGETRSVNFASSSNHSIATLSTFTSTHAVHREEQLERPLPVIVEGHGLVRQRRLPRQVVAECCDRPCNRETMLKYCGLLHKPKQIRRVQGAARGTSTQPNIANKSLRQVSSLTAGYLGSSCLNTKVDASTNYERPAFDMAEASNLQDDDVQFHPLILFSFRPLPNWSKPKSDRRLLKTRDTYQSTFFQHTSPVSNESQSDQDEHESHDFNTDIPTPVAEALLPTTTELHSSSTTGNRRRGNRRNNGYQSAEAYVLPNGNTDEDLIR